MGFGLGGMEWKGGVLKILFFVLCVWSMEGEVCLLSSVTSN